MYMLGDMALRDTRVPSFNCLFHLFAVPTSSQLDSERLVCL
jgi:hypothetical protein